MHQTSVCLSVYTRLLSTGSTRANKVASIGLTTFRVNAKHLIRNRRNCLKDTLYFDRAHCDRIRCERSVVATKERKKASEGGGRGIYGTRMACAFASTKWQSEDRLTAREGRKERVPDFRFYQTRGLLIRFFLLHGPVSNCLFGIRVVDAESPKKQNTYEEVRRLL